jgi:thioesterase domain-containing protein
MLVPVQSSGAKPPLFFMHGNYGIMPLGSTLARVLGSERPIYAVHAEGIDGSAPAIDNMQDMVAAYVAQIHSARPEGPIRLGGSCGGCTVAIEVAREFHKRQRETRSVLLVDPTIVRSFRIQSKLANTKRPEVMQQLYETIQKFFLELAKNPDNDLPFDIRDTNQLHTATLAGMGAITAHDTFAQSPFPGPVEVIVNKTRAAGFFHPQTPWRKLFPKGVTHVIPWNHQGLFEAGREYTARLVEFMLETTASSENIDDVTARVSIEYLLQST